jgi:hypothetical protein
LAPIILPAMANKISIFWQRRAEGGAVVQDRIQRAVGVVFHSLWVVLLDGIFEFEVPSRLHSTGFPASLQITNQNIPTCLLSVVFVRLTVFVSFLSVLEQNHSQYCEMS